MVHENKTPLRPTELTLDQVRSRLSGFHFSKECLPKGELEILLLAESLLQYIDQEKSEDKMRGPLISAVAQYVKEMCSDPSAQKAFFEDAWPDGVEYNDESRLLAKEIMQEFFDSIHLSVDALSNRIDRGG